MKVRMNLDGEWMVTRLSAEPDGTEPAAEVLIRVNVGAPNSYPEYTQIATCFTPHFMEHLNEMADQTIRELVAEHPDVAEEASNEVFEAARLAGFSLVEAQAMADDVLPGEGRSVG